MLIGVPKEVKADECRVGLTPESVHEVVQHGHQVIVERNCAIGIGVDDATYERAGAEVVNTAEEIFSRAELIVKVKEPQPSEYTQLRQNQILFTYLHLSPDIAQTEGLLKSGCIGIAYETVTSKQNTLPLLAPMSEVAGRMAVQVGAYHLQASSAGEGILLGGVPGVAPGKVVILGGGVAGANAAKIALGMGATVTVLDRNVDRLLYLDDIFSSRVQTIFSTKHSVEEAVSTADLVIGTVLIPGANAPKLITRTLLSKMKKGTVIVDVAIDQGGCCETSRPTTHQSPVYVEEGIVHYCVANMPGGVPRTSTYALNNVTLPYVIALANKGVRRALEDDKYLRTGLNVSRGQLTCCAVAKAQNREYTLIEDALKTL